MEMMMNNLTKILVILRKYNISDETIIDLMEGCIDDILEHKYRIIAHLYIIIDTYHQPHNGIKDIIKENTKKWILNMYYEDRETVIQNAKNYIQSKLGNWDIDFSKYDKNKLTDIISFLKLTLGSNQNSNSVNVNIVELNKVIVIENNYLANNQQKASYTDFKNTSIGPTSLIGGTKTLRRLHNLTRYQEKNVSHKDESEFLLYVTNVLNFSNEERITCQQFWTLYKSSKTMSSNSVKLRSKNLHYMYIMKLVTKYSYYDLTEAIMKSEYYSEKINIDSLCDLNTGKLHKTIEMSFDSFFYRITDNDFLIYKQNHDENKRIKLSYENSLLKDTYGDYPNLMKRIDILIASSATLDYNNCQNNLYNLIKKEGIKITKKDISKYIKKYY